MEVEHHQTVSLVLTTLENRETAKSLAKTLVEEQLAACVTEFPVVSRYRWKGELEESAEIQLLMKTSAEGVQRLVDRLESLHPYDTPEILVMKDVQASKAYGDWVHVSLKKE